jgi:serine phosphatase RsbU (regulator of sigma subunit)
MRILLFLILSYFCLSEAFSFSIVVDTLPKKLDTFWKYHPGDNLSWAEKNFDDNKWMKRKTNFSVEKDSFPGIGWFRIQLEVAPSLYGQNLAMDVKQDGASEIFLNGRLVKTLGKISSNPLEEITYTPSGIPILLQFDSLPVQVLAVRYSHQNAIANFKKYRSSDHGFSMTIEDNYEKNLNTSLEQIKVIIFIFIILTGFFFALSFVHFIFFLFNRRKYNSLFYSVFVLCFGILCWIGYIIAISNDPLWKDAAEYYIFFPTALLFPSVAAMLYFSFYNERKNGFLIHAALTMITVLAYYLHELAGIILLLFSLFFALADSLRITVLAIKNKKQGAWIVGSGAMFFILFFAGLVFSGLINGNIEINDSSAAGTVLIIMLLFSLISIPVAMSIYLSQDFALTNKRLIEEEKEKQQLIAEQKEQLEIKVTEQTAEIRAQKEELQLKNEEVFSSIRYARRIQKSFLPPNNAVKNVLSDAFVLYKPKDIVSGDFYWTAIEGDNFLYATADCTGHGVPGAFMSLIGTSFLNKIVLERKVTRPDLILNELRENIIGALNPEGIEEEAKDGMDITLCSLNLKTLELEFASAFNGLYLVRNNELQDIKGDKFPVGKYDSDNKPFNLHKIQLQKNDNIYTFSDGYADQFGGSEGKKLKTLNFKKLLMSIQDKTMDQQSLILNNHFEEWKGSLEQVDDVCVIGVRI